MLIDWFTVIAQIVNFLVLVYLLKRFLYGPIIKAIDTREQQVIGRLHEAEQQRGEAERRAQEYQQKQYVLESQREALFAAAQQEADESRGVLMQAARNEVDALKTRWQMSLRRSKQTFLNDLRQRASEAVVDVARRVLCDLADANLEQQIVAAFLKRLQQLDLVERSLLQQVLEQKQRVVVIQSAFTLSPDQHQQIEDVLHEEFMDGIMLDIVIEPTLICGIELIIGGHEVAWSIDSYLEVLDERLTQALAQEAHSEFMAVEVSEV